MYSNIEAERARHLLTKADLSDQLVISQTTYTSYVRRDTAIPSNKLLEMSEMFGCSVDYLLGLTESRERK